MSVLDWAVLKKCLFAVASQMFKEWVGRPGFFFFFFFFLYSG